jgi:hypothetical protein
MTTAQILNQFVPLPTSDFIKALRLMQILARPLRQRNQNQCGLPTLTLAECRTMTDETRSESRRLSLADVILTDSFGLADFV